MKAILWNIWGDRMSVGSELAAIACLIRRNDLMRGRGWTVRRNLLRTAFVGVDSCDCVQSRSFARSPQQEWWALDSEPAEPRWVMLTQKQLSK